MLFVVTIIISIILLLGIEKLVNKKKSLTSKKLTEAYYLLESESIQLTNFKTIMIGSRDKLLINLNAFIGYIDSKTYELILYSEEDIIALTTSNGDSVEVVIYKFENERYIEESVFNLLNKDYIIYVSDEKKVYISNFKDYMSCFYYELMLSTSNHRIIFINVVIVILLVIYTCYYWFY